MAYNTTKYSVEKVGPHSARVHPAARGAFLSSCHNAADKAKADRKSKQGHKAYEQIRESIQGSDWLLRT